MRSTRIWDFRISMATTGFNNLSKGKSSTKTQTSEEEGSNNGISRIKVEMGFSNKISTTNSNINLITISITTQIIIITPLSRL